MAERSKKNVFRDNSGNGCETNADYVGAYIGIGKEISPANSDTYSPLCALSSLLQKEVIYCTI